MKVNKIKPLKISDNHQIKLQDINNLKFKIKIRRGDIAYKNGDEIVIKTKVIK